MIEFNLAARQDQLPELLRAFAEFAAAAPKMPEPDDDLSQAEWAALNYDHLDDPEPWSALCDWHANGGLIALRAQVRNIEAEEAHHTEHPSNSAPTAIDLFKAIFTTTSDNVYTCSFTNERGAGPERHVISRKPAEIIPFVERNDVKGRGTFFCVSTIKAGAQKRNKDNVSEIAVLHADIDFKSVDGLPTDPQEALNEVARHLSRLRHWPSIIVFSGHGVHCYWLLKEALDAQAERDRIEVAMRQLADIVAGDLAVCEISRVMRLPGTHNSKDGHERIPVEIVQFDPDRRYELDDLEEWFAEQSPVMLRKVREHAVPAGADPDDFWGKYAKQHGVKAPIDVQKRLEGMMYMGGGDASVHQTQLQCTAALLNAGLHRDDVIENVLAYTKRAAGQYGARWNWRREERGLEQMCDDWLRKYPQEARKKASPTLRIVDQGAMPTVEVPIASARTVNTFEAPTVPESEPAQSGALAAAARSQENVVKLPVVKLGNKQQEREQHIALGRAVLAKMIDDGEKLINTKDGSWFYGGGVWELRTEPKWLNTRIERACRGLGFKSTTKLINETRNWIEREPDLWREEDIPWDQHGKIPTRPGLVDPRTGELEPAQPEHFATWRIDVDYDPSATCPWWETMIADMFGDKGAIEQRDLVGVVQELMGAALIDKKPRGVSKGCVFWGNENRAKSGVLDVVSGLFGGNPITAPIGMVDSTHGLMPFQRRAPWILHEAFGGKWHVSATVKQVVTGEPVLINLKNGPMINKVVRSPIFWATNFQPQFKEATKAIVNRLVIIEVTRAFDDSKPIGAAAEAIKRGFSKPGEFVVATELPGVLNWAIAGLRRALTRGAIASTKSLKATAKAIHEDSNLVAGFLEDCIEFDPAARIKPADFCLAHSAWWMELKGEDRRLPSNETIGKALKAIGDPRIGMDRSEMRDSTARYYCGIALNKAGLRYHRTAFESRMFEGKVATVTEPHGEVNSLIPPSWDTKQSVINCRNAFQAMTGSELVTTPTGHGEELVMTDDRSMGSHGPTGHDVGHDAK
ncbi:hypothetical protein [Bradyrhizobium sp. SZCCHNR3118]|uniref:hypothetical protein n=1 Tax=Bradyrhizobium sp. SZCCHNR3118 TaxID=3057468 RepID=UPI002917139A|nr:hypothetical protein [Bradyrhizobium sp. SZCCHNR3118]